MNEVSPLDNPYLALGQALIRFPQVIKIHQPNNRIFISNLEAFRDSLIVLWKSSDQISLYTYRGRIYINKTRVPNNKTSSVILGKLIELFDFLNCIGFAIKKPADFSDGHMIDFAEKLNQCRQESDPGTWLSQALANSWIIPLTRAIYDFNDISSMISGAGAFGSSGEAIEGEFSPNDSSEEGVEKIKRRAQVEKAHKSYSQALGTIENLYSQIGKGQTVGLQKSKRVVQNMIEALYEDENLVLGLSTIRNYDDYTCTHSVNVAILSMCLGQRLGIPKLALVPLGLSALFHDLGKVDVPVSLIRKPGSFTDDEYAEVKKHPVHSVREIIKLKAKYELKAKLLLPPFEHHLGIDLMGYPKTGRKASISLYGRILAIADHYDALTSSRSYRPVPISPERAIEIMIKQAGTELDPYILKVFINMLGIYPIGTLLILDSGDVAMVAKTPEEAEQGRPIVRILFNDGEKVRGGDTVDLAAKDETGRYLKNIRSCFHPADFALNPSVILNS